MRARALIIVVLLVSYGAVGARQPAVRIAATLPLPAEKIADALGIATVDRSHFVLDVIRTLFAVGLPEGDFRQRARFRELMNAPRTEKGEQVPLPLDVSIWRDTLLLRQVPDDQIMAAILSDRATALLYHGLAGMDDETLAWLGPERDTLRVLAKHAGAFGAFGPSVRVQAGKVIVPGGDEAEPIWQALVGADPAKPAAFVRRLFDDEMGYLAWFYDSLAQLDPARLRFALGATLPAGSRVDRARALLEAYKQGGPDWRPETQPFARRTVDPATTLAILAVDADGSPLGPISRGFWDRIFADSGGSPSAIRDAGPGDDTPIDAAWLLSRIHRVPVDVGRRRLEAFLFAQRMFPARRAGDLPEAIVIRGHIAFPALMLTLERSGVRTVPTMTAAIARAEALSVIGDEHRRRNALLQFQAMLAIVERMALSGGLPAIQAGGAVMTLAQIESSNRGYEGRLASWIKTNLVPRLRAAPRETPDLIEDLVIGAIAGVPAEGDAPRFVEWEGRSYRLSSAGAEAVRLHRVRRRQGGPSLTQAVDRAENRKNEDGERVLADTLASIVYAAYLGDPTGAALATSNIALRHDLAMTGSGGARGAWQLPTETHTQKGWRVTGSLLGLDVSLARLALRRMDSTVMPPEPRLVSAERQTASLTVALLNPALLTDAARDEISAAVARGRARLDAIGADRADIDRLARDAGLSSWRREAMAWAAVHDRQQVPLQLSMLELMWLGKPRISEAVALDGWGAAALPLTGCLCLTMPAAGPWETLMGRPALGVLATRGADVGILVAETLATLKMPAEIAPGVIAYVMQEVVDEARPAYFDDWTGFIRATRAVTKDRLADYIAAQAAGGALMAATADDRHH
jgi:hypothetical protein